MLETLESDLEEGCHVHTSTLVGPSLWRENVRVEFASFLGQPAAIKCLRRRVTVGICDLVVEDEFTAGDAAVDVINRTEKKQAGMSWHEIAPMRGRDKTILLSSHHESTIV
jgi:hypothetical protein